MSTINRVHQSQEEGFTAGNDFNGKERGGCVQTHEPMHVPEQPALSPLQQAWRNTKELCEVPVYEDK